MPEPNTAAKFAELVAAQDGVYRRVLQELAAGRKQTHWIWFIFPQLRGLGTSHMAEKFGLASLAEARSYWDHPLLRSRLRECTQAMLAIRSDQIHAILGYPDDLKFRSCMTLFAAAVPEEPLFAAALEKFFAREPDALTLRLLEAQSGGPPGQ